MNQKEMLLIFPPQWTPVSPHFAVPSLLGQLKSEGYNASVLDLNIEFYDSLLNHKRVNDALFTIQLQFEDLKRNIVNIYSPNKKENDYTLQEKIFFYKYNKLKTFIQTKLDSSKKIPAFIESAKNTFHNDGFYEPITLIKSLNVIDKALEIVSLPYSPTKVEFDAIQNPFFKFNYESIKFFVLHKESNIFADFYEKKIQQILDKNCGFIAISINSSSQIVPGLTLTYMLKQRTNAHINIGGNFFGRIAEELKEHPEFFDIFADSISVEEGEGPILDVAKFYNGDIPIEQVSNFMYKKDGKVVLNPKMKPIKLDAMHNMCFDGYDLTKYFAPEIVAPFQSSRGCYWGKCSFCDQDFGQNFNVKSIDKVISEFKEFKEKYGISKFEFIDESVSPMYMNDFSDKLISENMDVQYFCDARLETAFNSDILKKAHKAGLRMIMWGLESGSEKVMQLINKGIDLNRRFDILRDSKEALIWNFAFIFFGFPAETREDALQTLDMLIKNKDIIHSYGRSVFTMGRHAKLAQDPEKYGITKIYPAEEEFSPNINFDSSGSNQAQLREILELCRQECAKAYENPLWMYLRYREWLFLYICKYGAEWVSKYSVNIK